jgi:hypothetical protein
MLDFRLRGNDDRKPPRHARPNGPFAGESFLSRQPLATMRLLAGVQGRVFDDRLFSKPRRTMFASKGQPGYGRSGNCANIFA